MAKLFALEDEQSSSGNDLIIDKLLEKTKEAKSPLSLTADLLKQRQEITEEVKDQLEEDPDENKDNSEEDPEVPDDKKDSSDNEEDDNKDTSGESNDESGDENTDESKKDSNDDEEDDGAAAEDKDDLTSLIGSGLNKDEPNDKEEKKPKEEVSEESFRQPKTTLRNIFQPLVDHNSKYQLSLETYNLKSEAVPTEKQPIVYVKEAILESISNLTKVSFKYIENTNSFIETISAAALKLNERITVFSNLVDAKKYHFTHKLVKDKDILESISYKDHSDLRETSRILLKYIEQSNTAISLMVNNPFEELKGAFTAKEFTEDGTDLVFSKQLPGFNMVKVALEPYSNYLKTKLENFQYFKLKTVKTEDLYSLSAISVSEDKDLEYIVKTLNDLITVTSVSIDTLKGVAGYFTTFTDELKVLSFDVQNDQYKSLTDLGIDDKVKSFIKFKLAMEANFININMTLDYITSVTSVLDICLELSE